MKSFLIADHGFEGVICIYTIQKPHYIKDGQWGGVQLKAINPQNIRCQPYDTAKSRSKYGNWLKYVHLKLDGQMVPSSPMFTLLVPENFQL